MDNFVEEPIGNPENPEEPEYKVFSSNVGKEPLDLFNVSYHLLKSHFNYPVQSTDEAVNSLGEKQVDCIKILVDSEETRHKIKNIFSLLHGNDIFEFLYAIGKGKVGDMRDLLSGDLENVRYNLKAIKIDDPNFIPIIKRGFMSSYEMHKKLKHLNRSPASEETYKKLYVELNKEGVRPLTPEEAGGLLAPVIQKILDEHPDLRPNSPEESDF